MLTEGGDLKIADFGLAVQLESGTAMRNTFCGTPNYIAPEIVARESHGLSTQVYGKKVDKRTKEIQQEVRAVAHIDNHTSVSWGATDPYYPSDRAWM